MDDLITVSNTLFRWLKSFYDSFLSDWGIIGMAIISFLVIPRVTNFMRRMFR